MARVTPRSGRIRRRGLRSRGGDEYRVRVGQPVELAVRMEDDGLAADVMRIGRARQEASRSPCSRPGGPAGAESRASCARRPGSPSRRSCGTTLPGFCTGARGEATPAFDPPQVKTWEDTRAGANSPWGTALGRVPPFPTTGSGGRRSRSTSPGRTSSGRAATTERCTPTRT